MLYCFVILTVQTIADSSQSDEAESQMVDRIVSTISTGASCGLSAAESQGEGIVPWCGQKMFYIFFIDLSLAFTDKLYCINTMPH